MKRLLVLLALLGILAVPFALRPKKPVVGRTQDVVVIITPHNEALRHEFARAFQTWYFERTKRTVGIDWRVIGGTSEITRYLESEYTAAFERYWRQALRKPWSLEVQAAAQNPRLPEDAPEIAKEARAAFLASEVSCGIDLFFGGGTYDFIRQAQTGRIVDSGIVQRHPEWFTEETIPQHFAGEEYRDKHGLWIGTVLSNYGIIANLDALERLRVAVPEGWADLQNPAFFGELGLADPTKSASMAKAFENIVQQQMSERWQALREQEPGADPRVLETRAVEEGWLLGLKLIQRIAANGRYFTDTSQKPPIDVAQGNAAAGICIDFYGRQQQEALRRRGASDRVRYITPRGGAINSVDPIALLRGAPHREPARVFMEFVLSLEGQKIWNFKPGTPGGPERFALRRLPVRRDFYKQAEFDAFCTDPEDEPYNEKDLLIYREAWTRALFRELSFIIRVMCLDTHIELKEAWGAMITAGMPAPAIEELQQLAPVDYASARTRIKQALAAKDRTEELRLARELGEHFRTQYARARGIARMP